MRRQTNTINWSDDLPLAQGINLILRINNMKIDYKAARSTIGKYMLLTYPVIDLENSYGSWLGWWNGKEYLDYAFHASMSVGYNHPYILENANRLEKASLNKPANSDIYSTQMAEFVATMGKVVQPKYLPYAFYIEGGALAVENALKAAFDWKSEKFKNNKPQGGFSCSFEGLFSWKNWIHNVLNRFT